MHNFNSHEIEQHNREIVLRAKRRLQRMLDRFGQSLYEWLTAALNWPEEDWQADLENFVAHSRMTGIELSAESLAEIRGLVEARVSGTGVFAERARSGGDRGRSTVQLAALMKAPSSDTDTTVGLGEGPRPTFADGVEIAGPGPDTTLSFQEKVRFVLGTLDPAVARWWKSQSVEGLVKSRSAWGPRFNVTSSVVNGRPIVVVDKSFTAGQAAEAIIEHVKSGLFPLSIGTQFRRHRYEQSGDPEYFRRWQEAAFGEAAAYASTMAELYVGSLASLTPSGDLIVILDDISRNGFSFSQLLYALPMLGMVRTGFKRVVLKFASGKELSVPLKLIEDLNSLSASRRRMLLARAQAAETKEEALRRLRLEVIASVKGGQVHHAISATVHDALESHSKLKGKYKYRDKRFELIVKDQEAHYGWEEWHRKLDADVAKWLARNPTADEMKFEEFLRKIYSEPHLARRFAVGL